MSKMKKVLIAYDGSECAEAALEDLKNAGLRDSTEALVVCIADVFLPPPPGFLEDPLPEYIEKYVKKGWNYASRMIDDAKLMAERTAAKLKEDFPGWKIHSEAFAESPAWGIIRKAKEFNADLIVLGARGLSKAERILLGSVSQKVLAEAPCSVRIVHRRPMETTSSVRIIVGVDGSSYAEDALAEVASRAWKKGSSVHLVTVVDARMRTYIAAPEARARQWLKKSDAHEYEWINRMAKSYAEKLEAHGLSATYLVREGDAKTVLLEEAARWGADCLFVGVHGLSAIQKFMIGNVSSGLTTQAQCSIEVVRTSKEAVRPRELESIDAGNCRKDRN